MRRTKKEKQRKMINVEIKILIALMVIPFLIIIFKLYIVTGVQGDDFTVLMENSSDVYIYEETPRGEIFDRKGVLLAGNEQQTNLMYLNSEKTSFDHTIETIKKIDELIGLEELDMSELDYENLWLNTFPDDAGKIRDKYYETLTEEEAETASLDDANTYAREHLPDNYLEMLNDEYGSQKIVDNYILTTTSTGQNPIVIKEELSEEEIYKINENMGSLGGYYTGSDWQRTQTKLAKELSTMLGKTGKIEEEDWQYYQQIGYSINEEVGKSGIEESMEPVLHGQQDVYQLFYDDEGNITDKRLVEESGGGNDIFLTIDINLQKDINNEIRKYLQTETYAPTKEAYVTITEPDTGNILAISGQQDLGDDEFEEYSSGNYQAQYEIGSSIKPIVLLTGYEENVWEKGQIVNDAPMYYKGSPKMASWMNFGSIDETTAIMRSSNVYLWNVALALAGETYYPGGSLNIEESDYDVLRRSFADFGMGVSTGIDIEDEATGYIGTPTTPGQYLFLAIGQFDTYTTLQMNQYISTFSNSGERVKMNYVKSVNDSGGINSAGNIQNYTTTEILNIVPADAKEFDYVRELLLLPTNSNLGTGSNFVGSSYHMAGKTGTAETTITDPNNEFYGLETNNSSFIGFAPYENPEMAISAFVPFYNARGLGTSRSAPTLAESCSDIYFAKYAE